MKNSTVQTWMELNDCDSEYVGKHAVALAMQLVKDGEEEVLEKVTLDNGTVFDYEGKVYRVINDTDIGYAFEDAIKNGPWLEDARRQIPKHLQDYFDEYEYMRDLESDLSYGEVLGPYNDDWNEVVVDNVRYYIFRVQ